MKKNSVTISFAHLAKLHKKIKALEAKKDAPAEGQKSLTHFMLSKASPIDDKSDPKNVRTNRRILFTAGDFTTDPASLPGSEDLKVNLGYGDDEYATLQGRLNTLVKEYKSDASVSSDEMTDCDTVKDCNTMVNTKTT